MLVRHFPSRAVRGAAALLVSVSLVACAGGTGSDEKVLPRPTTTTEASTTTSTTGAPPPVTEAAAAAPSLPRPVRHSVLPANDGPAPRRATAATVAARRGPSPIGRIQIGRIGLDHAVYEGETLDVLKYGPGHWRGTAMPGGVGNTVFPGHRTTHTRPFWDIDRILKGDTVVFTTDAGRFTYQVTDTFVVDDSETWIANSTKDPTFTIFACHPKGSAKQRYVVKGNLVRSEPKSGGGSSGGSAPPPSPPPPPPATTTTTSPCIICLGP